MKPETKQRIIQLNNGEIPNGYKKTSVGIVPIEWTEHTLGDIFKFKNGINKEKEAFGQGTPIVNYTDVWKKRGLKAEDIKGRVVLSKNEIQNYEVKCGDVFFTRTSETIDEIGYSSVLLEDIENTIFSGFVLRARPYNNLVSKEYHQYCYSEPQMRHEIIKRSSMTTRALTSGPMLSQVAINLPSHREQSKIAEILMKWDEAIQLNEQLVEQLAKRKNAITYNLLTSAFRLPGFSEEWKEREISTYLEVRDTQQVPTEEAPLMAFVAGVGIVDKGERYDRSFLVKDDAKKYKRTEMDDFIYSSNNLDVGSIGLNKYGTAVISVVYEIFKVKSNAVPLVISEIIQLPYNLNKILSFRQGALYGQYKIHAENFLSVKIKVPSYEEQKKIAKLICMLDEELRAKQEYLEKIKQQRKALQQYLLNGIVRV